MHYATLIFLLYFCDFFTPHLHSTSPLWGPPLKYYHDVWHGRMRDYQVVRTHFSCFDTIHERDRWTDTAPWHSRAIHSVARQK